MADELRSDIAAAVSKMTTKVGGKREIRKLSDHLWDGEQVSWLATGTYGGGQGIVALTDRRLLFLKDGMMSQKSEDFPLGNISSIQWSSGLLMGKIVIFAAGAKTEIANVSKAEGKAIVDSVRGIIAGPSQGGPVSTPGLEQLQQLAVLRDQGILTEEEFTAKKAQILGL